MLEEIACVILSGGKSSRMGQDKSNLSFGLGFGEMPSLLDYQHQKMSAIFENVFVAAKNTQPPLANIKYLYEKNDIFSPLVGIENAFNQLLFDKIFFISVDTPFVKRSSIERLCSSKNKYDVLYPCTKEKSHYLISLWQKSALFALQDALKNKSFKLSSLIENLHTCALNFENEIEFSNLNTPEDYQKALEILRKQNG